MEPNKITYEAGIEMLQQYIQYWQLPVIIIDDCLCDISECLSNTYNIETVE